MATRNSMLSSILAKISLSVTGFTKTYWFDADDTATASSPIAHTGGATGTYLTNNNLGPNTSSYNPESKDALWNPSTNKFDFSSLKVGDIVDIRIDLRIDNAAAQGIRLFMSLAEGQASAFELSITHVYYKTAETNTPVTASLRFYIGDNDVKNNPGRLRFESPQAASIKVRGWFYDITSV